MARDPGFAERFAREAKALARLNHPNIVGVHDFGETDGLFYFVMEYVGGANLRRLIASKELASEQALEIVPQICEALQFTHDEGIVHRDIKPENILIDTHGRVKIADFGLAKLLDASARDQVLTQTHQVMGTPRYMAPEQMEGAQSVDHRADIYSLGVVFYELLTGELPLVRFDAPSQKAPIDGRLDKVVMRALEKELPRRYQHASELKTEVERLSDPAHETRPHLDRQSATSPPPKGASVRAMKQHVVILGVIHIALSSLVLFAALIVFSVLTGSGMISQDPNAIRITSLLGTSVGGLLAMLALPGIVAGFALMKFKQWARILILVLAVLNLANLPFGTALSAYCFWVLLHKDTVPLFSEGR